MLAILTSIGKSVGSIQYGQPIRLQISFFQSANFPEMSSIPIMGSFSLRRMVTMIVFLNQTIPILTSYLVNSTKTLKLVTPCKLKKDALYLERFLGKIVIWGSVFRRVRKCWKCFYSNRLPK